MTRISGSALLSALFLVTIVAIATTAMTIRIQSEIYRTRLSLTYDQLLLASDAVIFWSNHKLNKKNQQYPLNYPQNMENICPGIKLRGKLSDLQALFNLNNLNDRAFQVSFVNLLKSSLKSLSSDQQKQIFFAIVDWITPYRPGANNKKFMEAYLRHTAPYQTSHQLMQNPSEFRLIHGVNSKVYLTLLPYLTALPETTPINILSAPKAVLQTLGNGLTATQLKSFLELRTQHKLNRKALPAILQKYDIPAHQVTLDSQYFLLKSTTSKDQELLERYTILKRTRDNNSNKYVIQIIADSLNSY